MYRLSVFTQFIYATRSKSDYVGGITSLWISREFGHFQGILVSQVRFSLFCIKMMYYFVDYWIFLVLCRLTVPNGCSVELSHKGYQFLSTLFERYDKDKDDALSPKEVEAVFSTCPTPAFTSCVRDMVPTNSKVSIRGSVCEAS